MGEHMNLKKFILKYGIYIGFLGIVIIFSILSPRFLTIKNFMNILNPWNGKVKMFLNYQKGLLIVRKN